MNINIQCSIADIQGYSGIDTKLYQRENRKLHLPLWNSEKKVLTEISSREDSQSLLWEYLVKNGHLESAPRVGLHSMKVNPYELALVNLAKDIAGARSSRELFINFCKYVVNTKYPLEKHNSLMRK